MRLIQSLILSLFACITCAGEPAFRILIFMPGIPAFQERFWNEAIVETGLEPYVDHGKQVNALSASLYPREVLDLYPGEIPQRFYDWTRWRMDDDWLPEGAKYTHLMIDTEPYKRHLDGVDSAWAWQKMRFGYNADDVAYLNGMVKGARKATGLPIGHYRIPTLPIAPIGEEYDARIDTVRPIIEGADWVWQHEYSTEDVTEENRFAAIERQITQRQRLRSFGKPVWNAIWPGYTIPKGEVVSRFEYVLWSTKRWRDEYLIIWVDLDTPGDLDVHTNNMVELAPKLKQVLGVE